MNWVPRGIKVTLQQSYCQAGLITTFQRRGVMKENVKEHLEVRLRRAAMALVAMAAVVARTVYASPPNPDVVVPPTDLAALAPQTGDAMLPHFTVDGRIVLYIEQNQEARLAAFDVTDPLRIEGEGSEHLGASRLFDFVFPEGHQAESVRFPQGQEDEVLDLPSVGAPTLLAAHGLTLPGSMTDALTVTQPTMDASPALDFGAIDPVLTYEFNRLFDAKRVHAQMTRTDTGTSFMLTEDGLYVTKRPAVTGFTN
jgi:hypothetical protein